MRSAVPLVFDECSQPGFCIQVQVMLFKINTIMNEPTGNLFAGEGFARKEGWGWPVVALRLTFLRYGISCQFTFCFFVVNVNDFQVCFTRWHFPLYHIVFFKSD